MNLISLKRKIINYYINSRGWRTDRRIIVIESDDWGSIRMPSIDVYNKLLKLGCAVDMHPFLKYDSLESNTDLQNLFEVLSLYKDFVGNHPIITANTIMANPDFEKIEESGFNEYFYEPFNVTLNKYPDHDKVMNLYSKGIEHGIFFPQLHGLEHLNVNRWMRALKSGNGNASLIFKYQMFDLADYTDGSHWRNFVNK